MGFGNLGIWEMIIIAVIILIFFGPRRLPEIARSTGKAMREFKRGLNEIQRELELSEEEERRRAGREAVRSAPDAARGPIGGTARQAERPSRADEPSTPADAAPTVDATPAPATPTGEPSGASGEEGSDQQAPDPNQAELFGEARQG